LIQSRRRARCKINANDKHRENNEIIRGRVQHAQVVIICGKYCRSVCNPDKKLEVVKFKEIKSSKNNAALCVPN